ncbi:MAG: AraC family transcriptional regulator [Phycisphaeraceae bacterium]
MPTSTLIRSSTVRKRSPDPYRVRYQAVEPPRDFPIKIHYPHLHSDRPIEFLHVHRCWEIGCCFEGHGLFVVGSQVLPFAADHISVIGPAEPHLARSAPGSVSRWAWIYLDPIALLGTLEPDLAAIDPAPLRGPRFNNLISSAQNPWLVQLVQRLVTELTHPRADQHAAVRSLVWQIMIELRRIAPRQRKRPPSSAPFDRIAPALQHLARHYDQPLTLTELSSRCGLSQPQFRRVFHASVGKSPRDYWLDLRIRMAASLLRSSDSAILDISHRVGFNTLSSFNRAFRRILRTTPRTFRRGSEG